MPIIVLVIILILALCYAGVSKGIVTMDTGSGVVNTALGTCVLVVIGFLDPNNLGMVMTLGIVCTAGLGLIPFFFVAWCIGTLCMFLLQAIATGQAYATEEIEGASPRKGPPKGKTDSVRPPSGPLALNIQEIALRKYVADCRGIGNKDTEIRTRLLEQKWLVADIDAAMKK